ncbi:MAG TPA: DinB family protein [Bryobacteraceae bacterium]|nr:DinB family protein [Bryobacteraceae bacterium]
MRKTIPALLTGVLASAAFAYAAGAPTVASIYNGQIRGIESDIVPLAEAMPADKYNFAPTQGEFTGVRTFAQQAKHVAAVVYAMSAAALNEKPPVNIESEDGPASMQSKEQIVQFLKGAFAYAHKAANSLTAENQLDQVKAIGEGTMARGQAVGMVAWHSFDHYGQMVVYARMNGIVPPASRRR